MSVNTDLTKIMTKLEFMEKDIADIKSDVKQIKDSFATEEYVNNRADSNRNYIDKKVDPINDVMKKITWLVMSAIILALLGTILKLQ